ncbi:hypothetical protein AGMMS49928_29090 [Spirochaetia bacterium]|nr:hypothetical protein AGMMS49928_29090 [Spirochaetia bacterium]
MNLPQKIGHFDNVGLRYFHSFFPSQRRIEVYHGILNAFALGSNMRPFDALQKCIYHYVWEEEKNILNKKNHGFYFEEILAAFDDPFFLDAYDRDSSTLDEIRWKGIASFERRIYFFISYTERKERTRIISARLAEPLERERYDENYKQLTGYE